MYDVCIIGAGPAGSTLARILGSRHRVLLVDGRPLDREWVAGDAAKPCGGLLAPRAQAELARQGLGVPRSVVAGPQLFAVKTVDLQARVEKLYQRHYISVDRERFDRWLLSLVPDSVDVGIGWRAESIDTTGEVPFVSFSTPGAGRATVAARLVVGADGARSLARRTSVRSSLWRPSTYTAVQAVFSADWTDAHYGAVFDPRSTDFYGWTIPRGDALVAGLALPVPAGAHQRFDRFVASLREQGFTLGEERSRASAPIVRPSKPGDIVLHAGDVVLIGEAAGLVSPSSAEGISYALRSAAMLGRALEPGVEAAGQRYRAIARPLVAEVIAKLAKACVIYQPRVRRAVMVSGLGALHGAAGSHQASPVSVA